MKLLSVNVSLPKEIRIDGQVVRTGIFKEPVRGRVWVGRTNLAGDGQADPDAHGGEHKAVYAYTIENYHYWGRELVRADLAYGQFGENLTVEGMLEDAVHIGDVFRVGDALLEVSQPRVPCYKLGLKMGLPEFPKLFLTSLRLGFYLRVLEEGEVSAGDIIERVKVGPERMTVREIGRLLYFDKSNREGARRALRILALSPGWRVSFEKLAGRGSERLPPASNSCSD